MRHLIRKFGCLALFLSIMIGAFSPAPSEANVCLETIGGFGGSYIHMTYGYIGAVADAFAKDVYKPDQVKGMMEETVGYLDHLNNLLIRLNETNLADEDKRFVGSLREIIDLLKLEAKSLGQFSVSRDPADHNSYDKARMDVWPKIKQLLGMN